MDLNYNDVYRFSEMDIFDLPASSADLKNAVDVLGAFMKVKVNKCCFF
jgi:hypothetical protein